MCIYARMYTYNVTHACMHTDTDTRTHTHTNNETCMNYSTDYVVNNLRISLNMQNEKHENTNTV